MTREIEVRRTARIIKQADPGFHRYSSRQPRQSGSEAATVFLIIASLTVVAVILFAFGV